MSKKKIGMQSSDDIAASVSRTPNSQTPIPQHPRNGIFWVINGTLHSYPFTDGDRHGVAKSGKTYNHKALWETLNISNKPYNYYPRGRVCINRQGDAIIYLNPTINTSGIITGIKESFGLGVIACRVIEDHSEHYKCHTDADCFYWRN